MMPTRYLLDTCICIYIHRHKPGEVLARFQKLKTNGAILIDFYSKNCERLSKQYEKIPPEEINAKWSHFIPTTKPLILTLRHGPSPDDRRMYPAESGEICPLANRYGIDIVLNTESHDQLGRPEVSWATMVLWLPDDGTGALPLLSGILG
jgi:hypothetical protein